MKKIAFLSIGVIMIVGTIFYRNWSISQDNKYIFNKAVEIENQVEKKWSGFNLRKYPMVFRDETKEEVFYDGEIYKRKPSFETFACTASYVQGEMNVFVLSRKQMDSLAEIAEGLNNENEFLNKQFGFGEKALSDNMYLAILYHEAFHAYQQEKISFRDIDFDFNEGIRIINQIDKDQEIKELYNKERLAMLQAVKHGNKENIQEYIDEINKHRDERLKHLEKIFSSKEYNNLVKTEDFLETFEGTARFIELEVGRVLKDEKLVERHINTLKEYSSGREKYYRRGMAISCILEIKSKTWKEELFQRRQSIFDFLID